MDKIEMQSAVIRYFYPNITKTKCKRLRQLADKNKTKWFDDALLDNLDNMLASIVRHTETQYDQLVVVQDKRIARGNVKRGVKVMMQ